MAARTQAALAVGQPHRMVLWAAVHLAPPLAPAWLARAQRLVQGTVAVAQGGVGVAVIHSMAVLAAALVVLLLMVPTHLAALVVLLWQRVLARLPYLLPDAAR